VWPIGSDLESQPAAGLVDCKSQSAQYLPEISLRYFGAQVRRRSPCILPLPIEGAEFAAQPACEAVRGALRSKPSRPSGRARWLCESRKFRNTGAQECLRVSPTIGCGEGGNSPWGWHLRALSYGAAPVPHTRQLILVNPSARQMSVKGLTHGGDFRGRMSAVLSDFGAVLSCSNSVATAHGNRRRASIRWLSRTSMKWATRKDRSGPRPATRNLSYDSSALRPIAAENAPAISL
jgi:hypothetical protein